ncbi:endo-1,4-beta-xylanase [Cohnella sp. GCM10027633]|uniref:endo-1,4-beta-xylanase n=1 Tax=unclassified Cohnella TaxID=2636738 RepID=UPI00363D662F
MSRRMSRKVLVLLCSLMLTVSSMPFVANATGGGDTVVYDMQADSSITAAAEGSVFDGTDYLQNSGGTRSVEAYNGGKSIHLSARTSDYNGVDIKLNALGLTPGVAYSFTVNGHVEGSVTVPASSVIVLSNPNAFGPYGNYQWLENGPLTAGDFTLDYTTTFTASDISAIANNSYFRIQTNADAQNVPFYVDSIVVTKAAPTVIYDMQEDAGISAAAVDSEFGYTDYLQNSGGTRSIVAYEGGKSIHLSARSGDYNGVDIKLNSLGLTAGMEYTFTVNGHVDGDVTVPASSAIVLSNPNAFGPYNNYQWLTNGPLTTGDFTLQYKTALTSTDIAAIAGNSYFRIQTNAEAQNVPFYVDGIVITQTAAAAVPEWDLNLDSLHEAYENEFLFGNAVSSNQIANAEFVDMYKLHYNVLSAENEMKPQYLSPSEGVYTYANADALVDWALDNDILVHGHTLVWHSQSADWLTKNADGTPLTRADAKANMADYISNVAGHYEGKVISWDVVNEAFSGGSFNGDWKKSLRMGGQDGSPWYLAYANGADEEAGESGADYIYDAFVQTRLVDPNATLYYNDFNEEAPSKRDAIAAMVEDLNDQWAEDERNEEPDRLLIEGIGMQSHYFTESLSIENVENAIKRFIETGAKVTVSELDVPVGNYLNYNTSPLTQEQKVVQAQAYAQLFQLYKKYASSIERVTLWGIADQHSWRSEGDPLIFDRLYAAKEAYRAIMDPDGYIAEHPLPLPQTIPEASAAAGTPVIDGEADSVWTRATAINVNTKPNGQAQQAATAEVRTLWDNDYLYVYAKVSDSELNNASANPWEQDSVEVFLSETLHRGAEYKTGDGQYRVTFEGNESFKDSSTATGFESSAKIVDGGYVVELKIPFRVIEPAVGATVGFDVQLNDASTSIGRKLTVWSDLKANGYNTTENWGELTLAAAPVTSGPSNPIVFVPSEPGISQVGGVVTITPTVAVNNGAATASISGSNLNKALEQASANAEGKKRVAVEIPAQAGSTSYEVSLPTSNLKDSGTTVISIKTEQGSVDLPGDMLSKTEVGTEDSVTIRLGKASTAGLGDEVRKQIGDRPVINLEVLSGGKVIAWNNPNAPVTVSVPYKPTAEESANPDAIVIWYIDGQGVATPVPNARYDAATGTVVFKTTHFSNYAVTYAANTFGDLASVPWAKKAIEAMAARGIIAGTSDDAYAPNASIKRADFLLLLVRALELRGTDGAAATFDDVDASAYYADAVKIAGQLGIVQGTGNNQFGPDSPITRQDMMVLAMRALKAAGKQPTGTGSLESFDDASLVAAYARDSAAALATAGIVTGSGGKLDPLGSLTRAEAAVILHRLWSR